ncbi:restriction endonuclease subunit S [Pseudoalteromonas prydzensis]|uniref:restriction endonuclease subunit S n=1 Tax=Pseudoalteromonas prydzensis TaxID=182141 RepID=UPI003FD60ED3
MAFEMKKLNDVCRLINGRAYKKPEMLSEGKYPLLRVGNFFSNRAWYYSDLELNEDKYCDNGDLLYAWSASFGPRIWDGGKVIYHYHIWKIKINEELVDKGYLFHLLDWDTEQIKAEQGTGSTMIHVTKGSMENRYLPFPPIPEQKRIVTILDQAFADIEQARAKTEQNLKNARELFESYLQQVFSQRSEGWVETTLGNLSDINYGYTEKASFEANGPHFLRITDIQNNDVNWGKVPYCPISKADYAKHKLETGDIVFARTGATTGKSYLLSNPPEAVAASYLIRLRVKSDALLPEFVKFFFQTKGYWDVVNAGMTGSAQGGFNASKLAAMEITYPDCRDTQRVFVDKLSLVAQEIEQIISKYEKKLVVLDELKKSILQKAFSGELSKTLEVDTNKGAVA